MQKWGKIVRVVRELCARDTGVSLKELSETIDRPFNVSSGYLAKLLKDGEVVKAGVHGEFRYFVDREKAAKHHKTAVQEREKHKAETKAARNALRAQRGKEERARIRAEKGLPPYVPGEKKPKAAKKPRPAKEPREVYSKPADRYEQMKRQHLKANIIWPENVKVQVIPHGHDYRYKVNPPEGWKGQITQDWYDRRLAA